MKIVIVGGGRLGAELVASLAPEKHDLSLIDVDPAAVESLGSTYDILTMLGNGVNRKLQEEAGVAKANLLIAVGDSDEQNMLCCLIARKLGATHTIARVRDPEYYNQLEFLADDLGLSMYINPEESAAQEIARAIRLPGVHKADLFAGGKAELVEITLPPNSKADGLYLSEFGRTFNTKTLICTVKRGNSVTIPNGKFKLAAGDRISLMASPGELDKLLINMGHRRRSVRHIMIVGEGHIAFYLAGILSENDFRVTMVERDEKICRSLAEALPKVRVICGDGADQDFLLGEGLETYDAMAVLNSDDEDNIITAMYAETVGISKIAILLGRKALFPVAERVISGTVVNPQLTAASRIIQYVRAMNGSPGGNIESFYKIADGMAEALEFDAWRESKVVDIPLRELDVKPGILVACIIREENGVSSVVIPGGNDAIHAGDRVVIVTAEHKLGGLDEICD